MIKDMFDFGAMPTLERTVQFTQRRHRVLTDNIANLSTPYFEPRDLNTKSFQATLRNAIDERRNGITPGSGPLELRDTRQLRFERHGIVANPRPSRQGIMFHDHNNRDLERTMQSLAENTLAHNVAIEVLHNEYSIMLTAIRERV